MKAGSKIASIVSIGANRYQNNASAKRILGLASNSASFVNVNTIRRAFEPRSFNNALSSLLKDNLLQRDPNSIDPSRVKITDLGKKVQQEIINR